jgi:hypothetical protein
VNDLTTSTTVTVTTGDMCCCCTVGWINCPVHRTWVTPLYPMYPAAQGWICPKCGVANAPSVQMCGRCTPLWPITWVPWTYPYPQTGGTADGTGLPLVPNQTWCNSEIPNQPPNTKTFNCRFHPTDWWHEVGCPHREWTDEQLIKAGIDPNNRPTEPEITSVLTTTCQTNRGSN